jgi:hypothetical protein
MNAAKAATAASSVITLRNAAGSKAPAPYVKIRHVGHDYECAEQRRDAECSYDKIQAMEAPANEAITNP